MDSETQSSSRPYGNATQLMGVKSDTETETKPGISPERQDA